MWTEYLGRIDALDKDTPMQYRWFCKTCSYDLAIEGKTKFASYLRLKTARCACCRNEVEGIVRVWEDKIKKSKKKRT